MLHQYNIPEYKAWLWRIPIIVLIIIELASLLGYTNAQPSFTAAGLLLQAVIFYIFFESINFYIRKYQKMPPWWVATSMVGLLTMDALGDYLNWYNEFYYYDMIMHFLFPATATIGIWAIRKTFTMPISYKWLFFTLVPIVTTLGALYEIEEYLEDYFTGSHRLGDGFDTANDLLMDFLGALLPVVIGYMYYRLKNIRQHAKV